MNRCSGAKKGRSYSRADNIALPSPSSTDAMFTTGAAATSRDHFVNQSARLCVIPSIRVLCRSSNPTHETTSPPAACSMTEVRLLLRNNARTATSIAAGTTPTCHTGTLRIVRMALLTEPVPRSVQQV